MRNKGLLLVALVSLALATTPTLSSTDAEGAAEGRERTAIGETPSTPLMALPLGEAPGATTVITAEEIARSAAVNIFDLLRRVPGLDIRYTPMGGHIGVRSTGPSPFSEEVLLLIDGTPYNSPDKGGFPGHPNYRGFFPVDRIERIEIVRGPISVLYGPNAFGGVINIVSKQAADAVTDRVDGAAYGGTLVSGEKGTQETRLRAAMVRGGWDATFEVASAGGESPVRLNGDADQERLDVYATARRGGLTMSALHQQNSSAPFDFLGTTTRTARHNVDIIDTHYRRRVGAYTLGVAASMNRYQGTTCAACHNNRTREPDDAHTNEVGDEREVDQRFRLAVRADRTLTDAQDLTFGAEAAEDTVRRDIVKIEDSPGALTGGGVYVQHQWHFLDRSLHLLSGLRHDTLEGLSGVVSPRIALVAEPRESLVLRASWSRAYRAPTWNERFIRQRILPDEIAPGVIIVSYGNDDLEREQVDSAEVGLSSRLAPFLVMRLDLYHNTIREFIQRGPYRTVPGAPTEVQLLYQNREDPFFARGGEIAFLTRPSRELAVNLGYAYRDLSINWDDPHAAYAPRSRITFSAGWTPTERWTFDLQGSYSSRYTVSNPGTFGVRPQPQYQLWDAAARYGFPWAGGRVSLGLVGRNLFDQHPIESMNNPGIDTSLRGRVLAVELRADF